MSIKKALLGVLAVFATVLLVACHASKNNASQTADFQKLTAGKSDYRIHLVYQDDKVSKIVSTSTVLYSTIHADSADVAKQEMEQKGASKYDGIKGVEHKIDYQDDRLVEKVSVDVSKVDLNANASLLGIVGKENGRLDHISFQQSQQNIEAQGYTEVKDGNYQKLN